MKGNLCQLTLLQHIRRFASSLVSFFRRFCSFVSGHLTIQSPLKRVSYICLALLVLGLSLCFGSSVNAISLVQDVALKYATSGAPQFRINRGGNSWTSWSSEPYTLASSEHAEIIEIRSNNSSYFNISAGNYLAVEITLGNTSCDFAWSFQIGYENEFYYPLQVERLAETKSNSGNWCQQAFRIYYQSHSTGTVPIRIKPYPNNGLRGAYIGVISAQVWEFTDWNKVYKADEIIAAIKNQNNGASEIVAGINAGVNSLKQNDNANSQAQVGAINNAANQAHQDSQAQTNAINNQTQQDKDQYDQEKQEEQDRENQGKDDAEQLGGLFTFNILNPFTAFFDMFISGSSCASIPILASWVHSETSTVCSWWPSNVRDVLTPVFSIGFSMLLFGFLVRWLDKGKLSGSIELYG